MLMNDLFAGFDPSEVAAIAQAQAVDRAQVGLARVTRARHRHEVRRANSQAHLAEILPARFEAGDSWHVVSRGDVDALSYLRHALVGVSHFDHVLMSTWCIAKLDLEEIAAWLDAGRIDQFDLYAGEIFPSQYSDEYEAMQRMCETYGCRLVVAKNHSKITLARNVTDGYSLVIESSANVNTNPRIEQSAIHASAELYDFYLDFFSGIRSIDRRA